MNTLYFSKTRKFLASVSAVATIVAGLGGSLLFGAPSAFAGIGVGVAPDFPATVTVGQTAVPVGLELTNSSTADVGTTTVDTIFLTPQCGDLNVPCTTPDPGVFAVSATGTGALACSGINFTITEVDAATGKVQFTPSSAINLALGSVCRINFTVNVLKVPLHDVIGGDGIQTVQGGQVTAHAGQLPGSGIGTDVTTVNKVSPSIATTLSATTTPVNTPVHDSSALTGATANAGGSVTYSVFAGSSCSGTTTFSSTKTVTNSVIPDSDNFIPSSPGTYNWQAVYSGDANNNAATSTCQTETMVVTQLTPTVSTQIRNPNNTDITATTVPIGTVVHDHAVITGTGSTTPTGTVDFNVFSNPNCSGTSSAVQSAVALVNGQADSATTTITISGLSYMVHYNGDSIYTPANGICETLNASQNHPTITTTLSTTTAVNVGTVVHDSSTLTGATSNAGGTVSYTVFTNNTCSSGAQSAGTKTVTNGIVPDSNAITFNTPGDFYWQAVYSGDIANTAATSTCTEEHLVVVGHPSTIVTINSSASTTVASSTVTLTITERNDGDVNLTGAHVDVNNGVGTLSAPPTSGDDGDGILEPGETWTWIVPNVAVQTTTTFTATGHGMDPSNTDITYPLDPQEQASVTVTVINVQGCSPGYWKQSQHFGSYPAGIYPNTLFKDVFGVDAFPGKTLLQVLSTGGGGLTALGRIIVGAYLNAATISGFPYTTSQVIADFTSAYNSHNYETVKSKYEALQDPCPFGNNPGPAGPTTNAAVQISSDTPSKGELTSAINSNKGKEKNN